MNHEFRQLPGLTAEIHGRQNGGRNHKELPGLRAEGKLQEIPWNAFRVMRVLQAGDKAVTLIMAPGHDRLP
jgi:hypothetical protein